MTPMDAGAGFLFVTGGTGPTGAEAVARLAEDGWHLRCLVREAETEKYLPKDVSDDERITIVRGDLARPDEWSEEAKGAAAFLHLGHIRFAEGVVRVCKQRGIERLICLSSTRRFTKFPDPTAEAVIGGEAAVEASGLNYTILRCSMIYGTARDNNVQRLSEWLRKHRWMPLVAGGKNLVQPIHTGDVVQAIACALARPDATARKTLTIAGPEAIAWKAMVEAVAASVDRKILWVPVPYAAAIAAANLLRLLPGRPVATPAQIQRLLEDKSFDIEQAKDALADWQPRSFSPSKDPTA